VRVAEAASTEVYWGTWSPWPKGRQIDASEQLSVDVSAAIERYRTDMRVSQTKRLEQLQLVKESATVLSEILGKLDADTEHAILGHPALPNVHPRDVATQLKRLARQTETAKRRAPPPRRGPRDLSSLRQVVVEIGILWAEANPETAKGIKAVNGERRGPMLDYVWRELRGAEVRLQSKESLGKLLYSMRRLISSKASVERRRRRVIRKVGRVTVTSLE
jgi:hypothetical protein